MQARQTYEQSGDPIKVPFFPFEVIFGELILFAAINISIFVNFLKWLIIYRQ